MEAESTTSPLDLWQQEAQLAGSTGPGYLRFLGNTFENGPATSPLEYTFTIQQAGLYHLHLHCAKELHEGRNDVANDVYVRVEGDYTAGAGPHDSHGDNASLALLQSDTKFYGGRVDNWQWVSGDTNGGHLDPGGHQNKRIAVYNFKAGETYKLVMSGRSKFFRVNRIMFRHLSVAQNTAEALTQPESLVAGGTFSVVYGAHADFADLLSGEVNYYQDNGNDALAIDARVVADRNKFARASRTFDGPSGTYDVTLTTLTEEDGECLYRLLVNGTAVGTFTNTYIGAGSPLDMQPETHIWRGIQVSSGDAIAVESNTATNGEIPENGGTAWARGRWRQLEFFSNSVATLLVRPPAGRVAIVSDGNSPDPDDIGAKAVMFGLLNGAGLRDRLVHVSHSCDLDPFSNLGNQVIDAPNELRRQNKLHALTGEGIAFFGPFPNLTDYYNCRTEQVAAVNDLRDAINASSANDPLWIIEGGEPDIIGYALQAATASKRQFVHVISHHPANDNSGDYFTWQQILNFGVSEHQIGDQNVGLQVQISSGLWDWAEDHARPEIAWIWDQLKYAEQDRVVGFQSNKLDCSDAGMLYWWITGASNGGNNTSTPIEIRGLLEVAREAVDPNKPAAHWALDEGTGTLAGDSSGSGHSGTLMNGASWGSDDTRASYVSFDGSDDRIETLFDYALTANDDFTWVWWANQQSRGALDDGAIMVGNRYPQPGIGGENYEFIKLTPTHGQFSATSAVAAIERYNYGAIEQGSWHHYAMVKSGTSYQWYLDGVAKGDPVTVTYEQTAPIPFFIGGDDDGTGRVNEHFEGFIDDVVLYRRALSAEEVVEVQNGIYKPASDTREGSAGVMLGLPSDSDVRSDGVLLNVAQATLVPGRSGGAGGIDRASIFVFQLPDLGAVSDPFLAGSLTVHVETVSQAPPTVNLYGLGARDLPEVLVDDYYGETASLDQSDATLIQEDVMSGTTGTLVSSSREALANYLNEQYDGGNGAGRYLFLRLSTTAPIAGLQRHFVTSADGLDEASRPALQYTAIGPDAFTDWMLAHGGDAGEDSAKQGDLDGDGLTNWGEYLFGLDPQNASSATPFIAGLSRARGTFSYTRRNPVLTGVSQYQIWTSQDLAAWTQEAHARQIPHGQGEVQEVMVTLEAEDLAPAKLFVRLVVEE